MGWQDAPVVEDAQRPAWMNAPEVGGAPPAPSEPAWYDVPGKIGKTIDATGAKIDQEAAASVAGKQSPILGGAMSMLHTAGGIARGLGDIVSPLIDNPVTKGIIEGAGYVGSADKPVNEATPEQNAAANSAPSPVSDGLASVASGAKSLADEHPLAMSRLGSALDVASVLPAEKLGLGLGEAGLATASDATKALGAGIEDVSKTIKGGELKIPTSVAKKSYGADIAAKKQTIIDNLANFGATTGDNESSAATALAQAQERFDKADEIGQQLAADPSTPKVNPAEVAMRGIDVKSLASTGDRQSAQKIIDNVLEDMGADGHDQPVTLDQLIQAKQNLNNDGKLFMNGPGESSADQLAKAVKKKMYLNIVDEIGSISPEIQAMNTEGKNLLDVNAALSSASSRESNHNAVGLTDFILGGASIAHPGSLAVTAPLFATKKIFGGGRLGNIGINLGRAMQGKEANSIEGTLADIAAQRPLETPLTADLPEGAQVPAYFRAGVNPDAQQAAIDQAAAQQAAQQQAQQAADAAAVPNAIQSLRPTVTPQQEQLDAMRRWQAGQPPDYTLGGLGNKIGNMLSNERGAVGAAAENPQIHTDQFKSWFGDWKQAPEQASKVVNPDGSISDIRGSSAVPILGATALGSAGLLAGGLALQQKTRPMPGPAPRPLKYNALGLNLGNNAP